MDTTEPRQQFDLPMDQGVGNLVPMDHESSNGVLSNGNGNGNHSLMSEEMNGHGHAGPRSGEENAESFEERVDPIILKRSMPQKRWSCKEELAFYRTLVTYFNFIQVFCTSFNVILIELSINFPEINLLG